MEFTSSILSTCAFYLTKKLASDAKSDLIGKCNVKPIKFNVWKFKLTNTVQIKNG